MPLYDVFLSHASADKPAVERLAHKLREEGLEPFLDKWHLIPGEPWQEALEEALDQSRTCAVFLGKALGPWQNEEMRSALESRVRNGEFRVIPVLLPGGKERGKEKLPRFLGRLTWVDLRIGLDDEDAFRRLLAGIRGKAPGPGGGGEPHSLLDRYRCMAPPQEPFVQRSEYAKVRDALLADGSARGTTVGISTAIHGAGGFGKTALAIELCYDEQIRAQYPDGILWTTMGEEIDAAGRLARVRDLIRWWTDEDPPAFETVSAASAHLRQELDVKQALLVVDDVWRPEDVTPFEGLGPNTALLVTTRDSRTLPADSVPVHVDAMEISEAVRLLGAGLPAGAEAELETLAALLGEWPLLLKIVNRQVASWISKGLDLRKAIHRAEYALKTRGLTYFDPKDAKERSQASALTLEVSLERLPPKEQNRFAELAIFLEDANVPLTILEKLWQLDPLDAEELASRLFDLSLLRNLDLRSGTIRLHDVIRAYLLKKGERHLPEWHLRLLDACRPASGHWPDLPRDESYLWNHLFHHLIGAGQSDVCRALLLDFHYLRSKLSSTGVNALLADYSFFAEKDKELSLVRDALLLSAHVLTFNLAEFRGQLLGRLLDRREAGIQRLLQATEDSTALWLRPRKATLTRPSGALIRTVDHPGVLQSLAVLPDGRVISGSSSGRLRVWDMESGQVLQALEGHSNQVNAVAVLDGCRVVSGSWDGRLRVWDVESGQALQILEEPSSQFSAVAVMDSRWVISGSREGRLHVWDVESSQFLQALEGHVSMISAVAVMDRRRVITGSRDRTMRMWNVESIQSSENLQYSDSVNTVAATDSHRMISGSRDGKLRVWNVESGQPLQSIEGCSDSVSAVAMMDSCRLVSGSRDGRIRVWDTKDGQILQTLKGHSNCVTAVMVMDKRRLVSGSRDRKLVVWDVESGTPLQILRGHFGWVNTVARIDGRRVVSGSRDQTLLVWDVESGQILQDLEGHSNWVNAVAVMDSHRVISGSRDRTLRVWDIESGQTLQILEYSSEINAVAVMDSHWIVSGSADWMIQVWNMESGKVECLFTLDAPCHQLAVLLGCRVIVAVDSSGRVHFFDFIEPPPPG